MISARLTPIARCAGALALLVLSSCVSELQRMPSEPPPPEAFQPTFTSLVFSKAHGAKSNRIKYWDFGGRAERANVDNSVVEMRALLGASGATTVELITGTFEGGAAMARIEKVQLYIKSNRFRTIEDRPKSRTWAREFAGLTTGDIVVANVHVRLATGTRIHSLWLVAKVLRRPDLAVTNIAGPSQGWIDTPMTYVADISELNGHLGARANCLLRVDDIDVDQATGIWVDANGRVNCQFAYIFRTIGTHSVAITLTYVTPGDFSLANNSARMSVNVLKPSTPIASGEVALSDENFTSLFQETREGEFPINNLTERSVVRSSVFFSGRTTERVPMPIKRVDARLSADGQEILASALTELVSYTYTDESTIVDCVTYDLNGEWSEACTSSFNDGTSSSSLYYSHSTGTVTYYGRTLYCQTLGCDSYTRNTLEVSGSGLRYPLVLGSAVRLELTFVDATDMEHTVDRTLALEDFSASRNYTQGSCLMHWDRLGEYCWSQVGSGTVFRGNVSW